MAGTHGGGSGDLARGAIGLREVLFQSITSMAPAGAVALSIAAGATYAGGALPLSVLLALVGCLLVASSIGQLAKHLPSAGSIYTYPAEAIHPALLYYARRARSEFNWFLHGVIPVLGIIAFLPAWFTAMGIGGSVLKFVAPLSYPSDKTGLAIGIWYLIGVIALIYLYVRHPQRLPEMRRVFSDDELSPAGRPVATGEAQ
jgi:amino acid transporter